MGLFDSIFGTAADMGTFGAYSRGQQADAQQEIAMAQLEEAKRTQGMALARAEAQPSELLAMQKQSQMLDRLMGQQQQAIERQAQLLSKIDPTIMEAFQGIRDIMAGKESSFIAPLKNRLDIENQRQQNRLQAAMGGGYQSSSAGTQAQALFAQSAAEATQNAQMQALGALSGVANTGIGAAGATQQQTNAISALAGEANQNLFGMNDTIQKRQINALLGTNTTQYQGANSVGALTQASMNNQLFNSLASAAVGAAVGAKTGGANKAGAQAPKQAAPQQQTFYGYDDRQS